MTTEQPKQTPEEVKLALIDQLNKLYSPLISFIRNIPIDQEMGKYALQNLDQGILWMQQAIKALRFEVTNLPEGTENDECKEDATQASQKEREKTA